MLRCVVLSAERSSKMAYRIVRNVGIKRRLLPDVPAVLMKESPWR